YHLQKIHLNSIVKNTIYRKFLTLHSKFYIKKMAFFSGHERLYGQNAGQKNENCPIGEARLDSMRQKSKKKAKNCLIEPRYGTKCRVKE
ncbi:hypothetical protein P5F75_15165, partial [Caldifermentibacillus hisashii]|uniref:hypothetical protein n=1 Tax=Caldifermentibacillus hisashii TaxID=996558 RepID=UPI002E1FA455|nr:hypothetical protein [Caldifermentibacillus hisashii]